MGGKGSGRKAGGAGNKKVITSTKQKTVKISTKRKIGYRISDVGPGGKEYNVRKG